MIRKSCLLIFLLSLGFAASATIPICVEAAYALEEDSPKKKRKKKKKGRKRPKSKEDKAEKAFPKGPHEKAFREKLGEDYKRRYTDHFVVLYNGDKEVVKDFTRRIEQTFKSVYHFTDRLGIEVENPKEKMVVLFCPDFEEYDRQCKSFVNYGAPQNAAGLYWSGPNFSIFYDMSKSPALKDIDTKIRQLRKEARDAADRDQKKAKAKEIQWYVNRSKVYQQDNNRSVVQHEVAHQLLYNLQIHKLGARNPQWLVEGLATLFEPPPGRSGAGFNVINQRRLGDIREEVKKDTPESLREFVGAGAEHSGMLSSENYARSWALTYYLLKRKRKQFPKYIETVKKRSRMSEMTEEEAVADFEKAFGKIDQKFVDRWAKYIYKLPYVPRR